MLTRKDLRGFQVYLAEEIVEQAALLLAVDMSLGKTGTVLTAIRKLFDMCAVRRALAIAPLRVARDTWPEEIEKWEHTRVLTYTLIRAEDDTPEVVAAKVKDRARVKEGVRQRLVKEDTEIHIINREMVPWLVKQWGDKWPYDLVVWDESSRLKAGRKRTAGGKADAKGKRKRPLSEFGAICAVRKYISKIIELTGTPAPNGYRDLWGQIYLLDQGKRLGTSRTAFEQRWFDSDYMGWKLAPKPNAGVEIMDRIRDVMIGLRAEDHMELPPVLIGPEHDVKVKLPPKIMREYRDFEKTLVSEAYDVEAVSRGVLTNKLLQFANGSMYRKTDTGKRELLRIHDLKLEALESVVEEAAGQSIMLAYSFKFDLAQIKRKYPKAVIFTNEPDAVKLWNAGKIGLLLAHPASIGHGLNMQFGGHIAVWYGLTWSLELYLQFNKRLPRPGQVAEHVRIHHIVAQGTADEDVLTSMSVKGCTQDDINNAVRLRVKSA
jgi:SNF2 family DNA or RNA helicase